MPNCGSSAAGWSLPRYEHQHRHDTPRWRGWKRLCTHAKHTTASFGQRPLLSPAVTTPSYLVALLPEHTCQTPQLVRYEKSWTPTPTASTPRSMDHIRASRTFHRCTSPFAYIWKSRATQTTHNHLQRAHVRCHALPSSPLSGQCPPCNQPRAHRQLQLQIKL